MDEIQDTLEDMEEEVSSNPRPEVRSRILNMKSQLIRARKAIYPLREVIGEFSRSESDHIEKQTLPYIRDGYDHIIQLMEMVETSRELLSGIQDLYVTEISFRMNKVMQFLTIVTTIFVPITFLAGIYGMNFEHMPELHFENGYFVLISVMAVMAMGLVVFFKRKGWF
jgi:magnesium transporter